MLIVKFWREKDFPAMQNNSGKVTIVGAGPGDPTLITLRGLKVLQQADVVFYDYLVNPAVLDHAELSGDGPREVELVCLGRHGTGRMLSQEEINRRMTEAALAGKRVVRLKGGDPAIFGRTSEEIAALEAAGVCYEIVPGVTAAAAASSVAGIPITHRECASAVAFVTGQQCRSAEGDSLDMASLARFPGTLVFYMGVTTAPAWSAELIEHGKPAETPVAIIKRCTLAGQEIIKTSLGELSEVLAPGKLRPPAVVIVGEIVRVQAEAKFLTSQHLFGRTVLVTRPRHQSAEMALTLAEWGAATRLQPAIKITPPKDTSAVDSAIARLAEFDWLVFSSANGVQFFLERLLQTGHDLRHLGTCQLAAIGPATAAKLQEYHLRVDCLPEEYRAEALAEKLDTDASRKRFLLLRASRGREVLAETLTTSGASVEQVVVYESTDVSEPDPEIAADLADGQIDWITVTSSAIARSLVRIFGANLRQTKLAAISPLTAKVLTDAGFAPVAVAEKYTTAGLIEAIVGEERGARDT